MNALVGFMAQRAWQIFGIAAEFEVDALLRCVEFNVGYAPWRT
jgi:hypothetical protein